MKVTALAKDDRAATAVEFALALPVLAMLMIGILQFGLVLHTSGGLRHALGEGIRHAKINHDLSDEAVLEHTRSKLPAIDPAGVTSLTYRRGVEGGARFAVLSISYEMTPIIPFVPVSTIAISESKRAYLQN